MDKFKLIVFIFYLAFLHSQKSWIIKAESLSGNLKERYFSYEGSVKLQTDQATIYCNKLYGKLDENENIKDLTAVGSVHVISNNGTEVMGEKAVYNQEKRTLTISGSPRIIKDKNSLLAKEIIYYIDSDTFEAFGNVETIIYEEQKLK